MIDLCSVAHARDVVQLDTTTVDLHAWHVGGVLWPPRRVAAIWILCDLQWWQLLRCLCRSALGPPLPNSVQPLVERVALRDVLGRNLVELLVVYGHKVVVFLRHIRHPVWPLLAVLVDHGLDGTEHLVERIHRDRLRRNNVVVKGLLDHALACGRQLDAKLFRRGAHRLRIVDRLGCGAGLNSVLLLHQTEEAAEVLRRRHLRHLSSLDHLPHLAGRKVLPCVFHQFGIAHAGEVALRSLVLFLVGRVLELVPRCCVSDAA